MFALFINQLLESAYFREDDKPLAERQQVYLYFGTFSRSMLSMTELTLANWPPICRMFQENVSELCVPCFVLHKLMIGFAVVGVVNGVFMQETFKIASTDDRIMVRQKSLAKQAHTKKMRNLFEAADRIHGAQDCRLSLEELKKVVDTPYVRLWLASMDLNVSDVDTLFHLLDDGDGELTADELVNGVGRLKGAARSMDLILMMNEQKRLAESVDQLNSKLATR